MKTYRLYVNALLDVKANSLSEAVGCVKRLEGQHKLVLIANTTNDVMLLGCDCVQDAIANYGADAFEVV